MPYTVGARIVSIDLHIFSILFSKKPLRYASQNSTHENSLRGIESCKTHPSGSTSDSISYYLFAVLSAAASA